MSYRPIPTGDCDKCPAENVPIPFGHSTRDNKHCINCNRTRLESIKRHRMDTRPRKVEKVQYKPRKQRIPVSSKPTDALRELRDRDDAVNKEIWATRKHVCFECGKWLAVNPPPKGYFSHCHSKGARPDLRFEPRNIPLHCPKCHREWESGGRREITMPKTLNLYNELAVEFPDNRYNR